MEWLLILLAVLVLALLAASYYLCRFAIYPKVFSREAVYKSEVERGRLVEAEFDAWTKEELTVRSPFGYDLCGLYVPLDGSSKTIVISHGISWGMFGMVQYIPMFRKRGYNVLIYELRNHGCSGGENTTFGYYEKHDLKAVVDWAFSKLGPAGRVGTMGVSLGAVTTLQHAAIDDRVTFAIADCPFSDLGVLLKYRLRIEYHLPPFPIYPMGSLWSSVVTGMRFEQVSPVRDIETIRIPVMLVHSQGDKYIPPRMSEELFEHKRIGYRKLFLAPNGPHADAYWENREAYEREVHQFLEEVGKRGMGDPGSTSRVRSDE